MAAYVFIRGRRVCREGSDDVVVARGAAAEYGRHDRAGRVRGDQVVGVGNIDLRGDVPIIWKLYVLPSAQASGVGSALLAALLTCVPAGTEAVRLEYLDGNERAAAFYAAKGFTELRREPGEQPGWPDTVWVERRCQTPSERRS